MCNISNISHRKLEEYKGRDRGKVLFFLLAGKEASASRESTVRSRKLAFKTVQSVYFELIKPKRLLAVLRDRNSNAKISV